MVAGVVKVKGERLSFQSYGDVEQLITGAVTGATPTGWNLKVKGTYLHWVDDDGNERRILGTLTGGSLSAGIVKVKGEEIYYGDDDGNERYVSAIYTILCSNSQQIYIYTDTLTYTQAHDAANGSSPGENQRVSCGQSYFDALGTDEWEIYRPGLFFDTSGLPSGAVILSAVLSLHGGRNPDNDFIINVITGADLQEPAVAGDYGELLNDITSLGSFNTTGWSNSSYNDITLNPTGRDLINVGGITKFALRGSKDISSTQPVATDYVGIEGSNTAGKEPKLTITYG